jgi:prefoldin subunit 5
MRCVLVLCAAYQLQAGVTPIQKVITLLQDMKAKADGVARDEEIAFSAFKQWCDDTSRQRQQSIQKGEDLMEQLSAQIQKAQSDISTLSDEIQALDSQIGLWNQDKKAATEVRNKEKADYQTTHTDYSESIDAVSRALVVLKQQAHDRKQAGAALLQVTALKGVPASAKRVVEAFLQQSQDPLAVSAPEANAYEFQSGGVVDMLEKLQDKFRDERSSLEREEMDAKHAFEQMAQDLTDEVERATAEKGRKTRVMGQTKEDLATAQGDLADTTAARDADKTYLEDMVAGCEQKSGDFEQRKQLRADELVAIDKAIEILGSGAVSGAGEKHLPQLVQTSLSLLRSNGGAKSPLQAKAAAFLQAQAKKLGSKTLSLLAAKANDDPFGKVKKMIKDMIVRLMEEANEETEHKGWCDTELATNKVQRDSKSEQVATLTAQADQLTADIAKLTQEIADLSASIAELDAATAKATELRNAEKAKNKETIADAKAASVAVGQALAVLKEFYAKAAEATALVQGQQRGWEDDAPETFSKTYTGLGDENGGVVGMLEVIASDFARLESDTTTAEETAASEYKTFMNDSEVDKATKSTDSDNKSKTKTRKEGELVTTNKDLKGTQAELDAALSYYEKLKPSCVDAGVNYDDRVKRREEEIQSLKEALSILSGDDI